MATAEAAPAAPDAVAPSPPHPPQRAEDGGGAAAPGGLARLRSLRLSVVLWSAALITLALVASVVAIRAVLLDRLDDRIESELRQETEELRTLAGGRDPATGQPFDGDVARILEVFLRRNIPARHETMLGFVEGRPYLRSGRLPPARLDTDRALVAAWSAVEQPTRGTAETDAGTVDYLAVPMLAGGEVRGVFVVAIFSDLERREVDEVVRVAAIVGAVALVLTSLLAAALAGRVLEPLRATTDTARAITDSDLSRRVAAEGRGELAELARVINGMLDRLETAFRAQRAFLDDTGHELRTPITIIRGHLELMGDDPVDREETVALVLDELDRMHRLVEDLILLAKSGQPDFLRPEVVDLEALTEEVLGKAQALDDGRPWLTDGRARARIVADRQRLTQALVQLAHNAVEYTPPGTPVAIGSAVEGGVARLWVRDEGPGIPAAEQADLFERFVRGARGERARDGTGLGLPLVKAIAEAHGGRVELDSRPGAGARFTLVLPVDAGGAP
jgi:two-component system, OmpR family, sensor kinase